MKVRCALVEDSLAEACPLPRSRSSASTCLRESRGRSLTTAFALRPLAHPTELLVRPPRRPAHRPSTCVPARRTTHPPTCSRDSFVAWRTTTPSWPAAHEDAGASTLLGQMQEIAVAGAERGNLNYCQCDKLALVLSRRSARGAAMTATISTQQEWFSNYVSATMSVLGVHAPDRDGDLPVQGSTSRGWVRVQTDEPWGVRVFACAAYGVQAKVAVLKEINAVNLAVRGARVVLDKDGYVWVEYLLFADAVNTDN